MEISNILSLFSQSEYLIFLFIILPFIAQLGIPTGSLFLILLYASILNSFSQISLLFFVVLGFAVLGDLSAYMIGKRLKGTKLLSNILKFNYVNKLFSDSKSFLDRRGSLSVFLTRFLILAPGPYINYILGIHSFNFRKFITYVVLGEVIYSFELVTIGYIFSGTISDVASFLSNFSWTILTGVLLYYVAKKLIKGMFKKRVNNLKKLS